MKFNPDNPGFAIAYHDGKFAFVYREAEPSNLVPKLLLFTGRQQAEAYQFPGEIVEKPLAHWHRVAIKNNVTICLRDADDDYHIPPRVGWDFTSEDDGEGSVFFG